MERGIMSDPDHARKMERLLTFLHEWFLDGKSAIHAGTLVDDVETFEELVAQCTVGRVPQRKSGRDRMTVSMDREELGLILKVLQKPDHTGEIRENGTMVDLPDNDCDCDVHHAWRLVFAALRMAEGRNEGIHA